MSEVVAEERLPATSCDTINAEDLIRCVHCGFCLNYCPTYLQLGMETDSPRGRIHLIRALSEGRAGPTRNLLAHLDLCLQCRACQASCPSGVPYGRIMETARAQVLTSAGRPLSWRLRALILRQLLPYQRRLRLLASALRLYQRSGLQALLRRSRVLRWLPGGLADLENALPTIPPRFFKGEGILAEPASNPSRTVGLLTGCVMPVLYAHTHEATLRVLARNGCRVVAPLGQVCCGALNLHAGDLETARRLARRNIDAFLEAGVEAVITNSAGCSAAMKEYGELLADDPEYAEKARSFAGMVRDITEYLVELPFKDGLGPLPQRVTYQDPCHLAHAQGITRPPRDILAAIPELELVEMEEADRCCGSGGIYSVVQREMSAQLLENKMRAVAATGAGVIATANPGCAMQLEAGLRRHGLEGRVVHVVELLDQAYQATEEQQAS
jgi:glycolate oxidase iron-sulfur subunit